jgi:hypothetical protein
MIKFSDFGYTSCDKIPTVILISNGYTKFFSENITDNRPICMLIGFLPLISKSDFLPSTFTQCEIFFLL